MHKKHVEILLTAKSHSLTGSTYCHNTGTLQLKSVLNECLFMSCKEWTSRVCIFRAVDFCFQDNRLNLCCESWEEGAEGNIIKDFNLFNIHSVAPICYLLYPVAAYCSSKASMCQLSFYSNNQKFCFI